ncbi:MAG: DUF4160 domain-containing protein [Caldilinea sp.]|nr:DUF4160 domain-containing protein [Caldilinea sp.]MCB0137516.1 DUF4160 domain-containing protein [Caldilineaceae bacterium]MCB0042587.1 DUF4160 domain-containing protein [Caldilinea sp.]MCB9114931.1 DUF4160 domain-containing protein [Caldilineaceae bacterium]MCB9121625.1 DUF4160 domain-containing protein [Caldilineaceae bacterium]
MPILYRYFGLLILVYSNEHEPIHVHGRYQGTESKAELIVVDGQVVEIRIVRVPGKKPLATPQLRDFQLIVEQHAEEIVQKWIDYFILHRRISPEDITRRIR